VTEATSQVVADTQVLVWYLTDSTKLSAAAQHALEACVAGDDPIVVNGISLVGDRLRRREGQEPIDRLAARLCLRGP